MIVKVSADLSEISESLRRTIADPEARIRFVVETGADEAGMVATASGYLRLAQALVEFVAKAEAGKTEVWTINGSLLPASTTTGALFGPDEIRIDSVMLAANEGAVTAIAEYFWRLSPTHQPPPSS